ncbi:hypothetical protein [Macellibacteroides fermentans]|uniref:hypothetical protein n=1 Tax=Macellibacteroides fermentans TaxID=879969 RepID=UPI00406D20F7
MEYKGLAPNETMQLHEILTLKNLCLTKSVTMSPLAVDEELKLILQNDATKTAQHIKELKNLMEQSGLADAEQFH